MKYRLWRRIAFIARCYTLVMASVHDPSPLMGTQPSRDIRLWLHDGIAHEGQKCSNSPVICAVEEDECKGFGSCNDFGETPQLSRTGHSSCSVKRCMQNNSMPRSALCPRTRTWNMRYQERAEEAPHIAMKLFRSGWVTRQQLQPHSQIIPGSGWMQEHQERR